MRKRLAPDGLLDRPPLPGLRLPGRGQKILVAVSGGLDSMVLLHILRALAGVHRWKLAVAHFNHRLRGAASNGDEAFVRKSAAAMKLPVFVGAADVQQIATTEKVSIEMAARRLRHEFLAHTALLHGIKTVALAHHADDQVELFFLRLLRGAGSGLAGMQWRSPSPVDSGISLIRPLLDLPKAGLEEYAYKNGIHYREDATNLSPDFLRNRIRQELLPLLRKNYQPALNRTVLRSMEIAGAESNLVAELARAWLNKREFWRGGQKEDRARSSFAESDFEELPEAIQRRVIKLQIIKLGVTPDFELIETVRNMPKKPVAESVDISVSRDATGQVLLHRHLAATFDDHSVAVKLNTSDALIFDGVVLKWGFERARYLQKAAKPTTATEFFDADKIGKQIVLRHWRAGDRFHPIGLSNAVKLQDLFTNARVPRELRHQLVLAEARSGIFWVEGLRMSENFKLTAETQRVLTWRWRRPGD
jgi:tRNA(Ile)-lysidine synthase